MKLSNTKIVAASTIGSRLKSEWLLKIIFLFTLNLWVYAPYLFLQRHHFFPTTTMPSSFCDRLIPFLPQTVWIYLSIDFLMPIGPFLMNRRQQIFRYAFGIVLIGAIADVIFLFWPTSCPRPNAGGTNAVYQTLVSIDNSFHAFPSLHAAFAVYSAMCGTMVMRELSNSKIWQIVFWLWVFLILLATLTTKQHVILDILGGSALGFGIFNCVFGKWSFISKHKTDLQSVTANLTQSNSNSL
ncbi:MAG TPA: phosphatase PAP2 family protein [Verrucomicrobiae bacterium]|nr:phosphatase PAP2 family protein [Verrucomicrobiae bacterium]